MPHQRLRFAEAALRKMAKFWPIVGVLGLRQVGKSTLLRDRLNIPNYLTFDDPDVKSEAETSPKAFLSRWSTFPGAATQLTGTVLDEVQKVPQIFDTLKAMVDRKKIPGRWYLSGSVAFSTKVGVRESLTGRIGMLHLFPMSYAEIKQKEPLATVSTLGIGSKAEGSGPFLKGSPSKPRFSISELSTQINLGGLPVPAFLRDDRVRAHYWDQWLETTLVRDAQKAYGSGYDPEYCFSLVRMLAKALPEGEYPSLDFVNGDKRKAKRYIQALQDIFVLRRFTVHEAGVGKDHWIFGDSGLAFRLSPQQTGAGVLLSVARHSILNEIFCFNEYQGTPRRNLYFKSARGSVVDFFWDGVPIKIIAEAVSGSALGYHERALNGAMKALGSKRGILVAATDTVYMPKAGIAVVPWSYWS